MGTRHFCLGCDKQHDSSLWYYRRTVDPADKEWLCGLRFLLLPQLDTRLWLMFPTSD